MDLAQLMEACNQYAKPAGFRPAYGTAGFRAEASLLHSTVFRCASCYLHTHLCLTYHSLCSVDCIPSMIYYCDALQSARTWLITIEHDVGLVHCSMTGASCTFAVFPDAACSWRQGP